MIIPIRKQFLRNCNVSQTLTGIEPNTFVLLVQWSTDFIDFGERSFSQK